MPKPTALKEAEGNPGKRALNKNEPRPTAGAPRCPAWLSERAREIWMETVPELEAIGVLTTVDGAALASYCEVLERIELAREEVRVHGLTFVTKFQDRDGNVHDGDLKKNPAVTVLEKATDQLRHFSSLFGLNPASRSRLSVTPADDAPGQALKEFLQKGESVQ